MLRIIAGEMRSRKLKTPEGSDTRPTADRVREALFSMLQARVYGARVLDLYGGSGALALEALSRGAESAVICDQAAKACRVIRENIDALGCGARARLIHARDTAALDALEKEGAGFDLVFLDPPYKLETGPVCQRIAQKLLLPGGMIVAEHARETPPQVAAPLECRGRRIYGITGLTFIQRAGEE